MASKLIRNQGKASGIAHKHRPLIIHAHKSDKDYITPFIFDTDEIIMEMMSVLQKNPTLYYVVREDDEYYYCFYLVFHPFDWSDNRSPLIRKLDSHKYDSESICMRVHKETEVIDIATVFHYRILFQENVGMGVVFIEYGGHGIMPSRYCNFDVNEVPIKVYLDYNLVSLANVTGGQWKIIKRLLNGVQIPHEQGDGRWLRNPIGIIRHKRGDMFLRPDILFKKAEIWRF